MLRAITIGALRTTLYLQMQDSLCGLCGEPFQRGDLVPLNGTTEQVQELKGQLDRRRARKDSKKGSKATKRKHDAVGLLGS
jgi:hypothetical protein